jgi:ankyrin repeat protein
VLGLATYDLEALLEASTTSVNQKDGRSRTALYWAARRGNFEAVGILLRHGADPNIGNRHDVMPLHHAVGACNPDSIRLLLEHGSLVNKQDHRSYTALHYLSSYKNDPSYGLPLLEYGAAINVQAQHGVTPLTMAATRDQHRIAELYLEYGADIELSDDIGSPLLNAITFNSHSTIRLLLTRGASCTTQDRKKNTLLHIAAKYGDLETLKILIRARATPIDGMILNEESKTASEIATERHDTTEEFETAWDHLFQSCMNEEYFDCSE